MLPPVGGSGRRPFNRAMMQGTAELLDDAGKPPEPSGEPLCGPVVAQAESEDFQEFSPTRVRRCGSRLDVVVDAFRTEPKQRSWDEDEEEKGTMRSLRVRRTDWLHSPGDVTMSQADVIAPPPQFKDSPDDDGDSSQRSGGRSQQSESEEASSAFSSSSSWLAERECGSAPSSRVVSLCPYLTHVSQRHLLDWRASPHSNRGFLLHDQLRPVTGRYREGCEYTVLHHIHSGAYGDVVCVRDCNTRFTCAAKKVPASRFREEEVTSWSLASSPRVVRLFGAVREGPHVVLFMDLKPAGLAQLLAASGRLPRDLALHYLWQTLGALQHLHRRKVLHLDVKVDNVLLSADLTNSFLCDFGLSRVLDKSERSTQGMMGAASLAGTETHMAPEVALGVAASAKADVWSGCCMLLHMLNGRQPWLRRYAPPLCLHIVTQPAPLWEVPPGCDRATRRIFRAGLRKDPDRRDSAGRLRGKTAVALKAVGGLSAASVRTAHEKLYGSRTAPAADRSPAMHWVSPWRTRAADEDDRDPEEADSLAPQSAAADVYVGEEDGRYEDYEGDCEDCEDEEDEEDEEASARYLRALLEVFPLLRRGRQAGGARGGSDGQLEELRDGAGLRADTRTPTPEPRDDPPSCFSSSSQASEKDSECSSDDVSSGVLSSCGGLVESSAYARGAPSRCFEGNATECYIAFDHVTAPGVDVRIEDARGERVRIRERQRVRVGHVAVGIGRQVTSTLEPRETCRQQRIAPVIDAPLKKLIVALVEQPQMSLTCQRAPSPWRHWTGSRCPSGGSSASRLSGFDAWPRPTGVRVGRGEFETANWKSDNDPDSGPARRGVSLGRLQTQSPTLTVSMTARRPPAPHRRWPDPAATHFFHRYDEINTFADFYLNSIFGTVCPRYPGCSGTSGECSALGYLAPVSQATSYSWLASAAKYCAAHSLSSCASTATLS
ncbi:mitogen-activated protein kinase kinase kinase 14-like isoform X2 [Phyllopteryx taeniolatus]|nr:mitogen-activated protein kinase kinase kinase 14-like isoform X2 [Phyllopteryx taeniolatus]